VLRSGVVRLVFHPPIEPTAEPAGALATRVRDQICSVGLIRREAHDDADPPSRGDVPPPA
jgi:hypothetical protein